MVMASRIISFDILRGWAIIGNLMVHTFMLVSRVQRIAETTPDLLDTSGYIMMGLIVVFGHWRGLFLLISACVHMLMMQMKLKRGLRREVILVQELFKGLLLWLWSMFFYVFLAQWQLSKEWVETGTSSIEWQNIYHADQFANIAWAIMISAVLFYILTSNKKLKKPLVMSIVFAIVGCLSIFSAPVIHEAARVFWRVDFHSTINQNTGFFGALGYEGWKEFFNGTGFTGTWDYIVRYRGGHLSYIGEKGWWDYPLRLVANQFVATESPLLPNFAYSAVGSILGIYLSQEKKPKKEKFLLWGYGLAGATIVFGVFWLFVVEGIPDDPFMLVDFHVHPTWFVWVTIGMLLFVVIGLMHGHEYSEKINWEKRLKWSRFSRRVGFLSLSVYSFASSSATKSYFTFNFPKSRFQIIFRIKHRNDLPSNGYRNMLVVWNFMAMGKMEL